MRTHAYVAIAFALSGCADILGIQDRYFDDGGATDAPIGDAPPTESGGDASNDCGTCTSNGTGCVVLACHQDTPTAIATTTTSVYWSNSSPAGSNNAVMSADLGGGNVKVAFQGGGNELPGLVSLQNEVYASTFVGGAVIKVSAGTPIATAPFVYALAVDALNGYFAYSSFGNSGSVWMCGAPAQCSTSIEVIKSQANIQGTAVDGANVYWSTTTSAPGVYSCPWIATCNSPTLLAASPTPTLVTVDNTYVYWVDDNFSSATIYRAVKTDGTGKTALAFTSSSILSFVVSGTNVYYTSIGAVPGTGKVTRVKNDGTSASDLATNLTSPAGVTVDSTYAYFTEWGPYVEGGFSTDGRVMRVPK